MTTSEAATKYAGLVDSFPETILASLEGKKERKSVDDKLTICAECRWCGIATCYCKAPTLRRGINYQYGGKEDVLCSGVNTDGNCPHFEKRPPSWWARLWGGISTKTNIEEAR